MVADAFDTRWSPQKPCLCRCLFANELSGWAAYLWVAYYPSLKSGPKTVAVWVVAPTEKNLMVLKGILEQTPGARLAFVGDGPQREELERHFAGMPVKFMVSKADLGQLDCISSHQGFHLQLACLARSACLQDAQVPFKHCLGPSIIKQRPAHSSWNYAVSWSFRLKALAHPLAPLVLPHPQGMMKGQELSEAYASADIFVMPSETETLGFVVLEAMASGVPVVAVAAGGLTDIITQPGKTGLLFNPEDYATCTAHVQRLIADEEARKELGAAGRAEVELFGWSAATRMLREQQYARAIKMSRGKRRFWWLALRVGIGRLLRALAGTLVASFAAIITLLDYARAYRPQPPIAA